MHIQEIHVLGVCMCVMRCVVVVVFRVMSTLNLLRYILLRDKKDINQVSGD